MKVSDINAKYYRCILYRYTDENKEVQIDLKVLSENDEDTIYNILFRDELENS